MRVVMPQLGETVEEGTVTVWHKKPGDHVEADEVLFEVSTDKVDTEVPAPASGTLTRILVDEGETVKVGTALAVIGDEAEEPTSNGGATGVDIVMPQLGETVEEGTVVTWHKQVGDHVEADEILFDVSTDKVDTEVPAPVSGTLTAILVPDGETVKVGTRLAVIGGSGNESQPEAAPKTTAVKRPPRSPHAAVPSTRPGSRNRDSQGRPLSPVVRRLLAEHSLDPATVAGTGEGGRIKRDDVLAVIARGGAQRPAQPVRLKVPPGASVVPFSKLRKLTAEHMVRSKATSAHVLQAVEVDFARIEDARDVHGAGWKEREGFSLTYLPFIARAVCQAIADFPRVNASVDIDRLIVHGGVNLAIAVDLDHEGLVAPVLKGAEALSVADLARRIRALSDAARSNGLSPDDLTEGTYTISNSGVFGTLITAPVINQPQVAILSTDGIRKKPVVIETDKGDELAIRPVGVLAQSFDHRAIDGAYSAAYLDRLRSIIETTDWVSALND